MAERNAFPMAGGIALIIHSFKNGDTLEKRHDAIIARFSGLRNVLSTAPLNGGAQDDLRWVFNYGGEVSGVLKAPTYEEHVYQLAHELGLSPDFSSGLSTAALMDNVSIKTMESGELSVTAVVTGGVDVNAGRAGDKALWKEENGEITQIAGTINILLFIEADLSSRALARALVTCTEAKTAALQELLVPSRYSCGLATGSGTDGTIIVADPNSSLKLSEAGKHFLLGEMIGKTVIEAVKDALFLQTGLCPERQNDIFKRMDRFGITEDSLISRALKMGIAYGSFVDKLPALTSNRELVVYSSLYAHLLDQLSWGMIAEEEALKAADSLLDLMGMPKLTQQSDASETLINAYLEGLIEKIK